MENWCGKIFVGGTMKIYILDENGHVIFEYVNDTGGYTLSTSYETRARATSFVGKVLRFLLGPKQ